MSRNKKQAIRIAAGFFIAMAVCTIVARFASSMLVAQVTVDTVRKGHLSYKYNGKGTITAASEQQIFLWSEQQIEKAAKEGSAVKKGECLVQFRKEFLDKAVEKKQAQTEQLRLQKEQQQVTAQGIQRVAASESAWNTLQSAYERLDKAQQKEAQAQSDYEAVCNENAAADSETKTENDTAASQTKEEELYQAFKSAQTERESVEQTVTEAQNAYDQACKEDAAQSANDANTTQSAELGVQNLEVQLAQSQKELDELKKYQEADGKILADQDCVVLKAGVTAGAITTGAEVMVIGTGGWKLKGTIDAEDSDKLSVGTKVDVTIGSSGSRTVEIQSMEKAESEKSNQTAGADSGNTQNESSVWYAVLPDETKGTYNQAFSWSAEVETAQEYEQKIPLTALRETTEGAYCLVLTDASSMLGTVQKAKRVPVQILEKDGDNAAVASELSIEDQIIVTSEKYVEEGDQVRITENEN